MTTNRPAQCDAPEWPIREPDEVIWWDDTEDYAPDGPTVRQRRVVRYGEEIRAEELRSCWPHYGGHWHPMDEIPDEEIRCLTDAIHNLVKRISLKSREYFLGFSLESHSGKEYKGV